MSLAATTTLINTVTTDAAFRTWGLAYNAKLAAAGLVATTGVGEVNWTTVTAAAGANTVQGYEIWHFNDALQATAPIFLKIEYGSGAVAANGSLWLQLGSGQNGAGGLTGVLSTRQQIQCSATAGAITHYWSGDTNRFGVAATGASSATSVGIFVERTVDTSGAVTSEGALLVYKGTSAAGQQYWNQVTGPGTATWETTLGSMGPSLAPFGTYGTQVAVYPVFHSKGVFLNPGLNIYLYENALITVNAAVTFTVYSASHTFMPLGSTNFGGTPRGGFLTSAMMMRYE
jgi:hypothetical protein